MLPGEPIYVDPHTTPQESFAVELRSMCGYSGSPVFVDFGGARRIRGSTLVTTMASDFCLGVHWGNIIEPWQVETKIVKKAVPTALAPDEKEIDLVLANTGMNGVVPAWRLLELLNLPKIKEPRDRDEAAQVERRKRETPSASPNSATGDASAATDENPKHREDFTSLVGAAARKQKRAGQT